MLLLVLPTVSMLMLSGPDEGGVAIRWTLGAGVEACEDVGIDRVEVTLEREEDGESLGTRDAPCATGFADVYAITQLKEGEYRILVEAFAGDERLYTGRSRRPTRVQARDVTWAVPIALQPTSASLEAPWRFEDGRPCGFHGVDEMLVEVFLGRTVAREAVIACSDGAALFAGFLPGTYDVAVTALDPSTDEPVFRYIEAGVALEAGKRVTLDGVLRAGEDLDDDGP